MNFRLDPEKFDRSVKPTEDFFRFVNQRWIDENPIPSDEASWGSFYELRRDVELQIKELLEALDARPDKEVIGRMRKVRDFYRTGMDVERRNKQAESALAELFAAVDAVRDIAGLSQTVGMLHRAGVDVWWAPQADSDAKQSDVMALYLNQGGIGLPDRDYYLKDDQKSAEIRNNYLAYMERTIAGSAFASGGAAPRSAELMDLEGRLAEASMTRVELRDIEKQYNKFTAAALAELAPAIDWQRYAQGAGISMPKEVIVCQPDFVRAADGFFRDLPIDVHKAYLRWHILNDYAHCLDAPREASRFDFYGRTFSGATEMKELWRRVQGVVSRMLDEAVGELYVGAHFSEDAKKKINELVDRLFAAYRSRIEKLDWMGTETKQKALAKLSAVPRKLGYPDKWKNIDAMVIGADSYATNVMNAYRFEFDRKARQVGGPVDRTEWYMSPQSVNACYNPLFNEILFPAAILQPPFFDPAADPAVNFGGIGTVIGHELTHGFDDQGALFDERGNLANWWTKEDKERFDAKTERLAKQFNKFEALRGLFVNGQLTLGENIADLGGLVIAYDALTAGLREEGNDPAIDGLSPIQRFFANYAITERSAIREEALRSRIQIDPHAPSPFRVNGPLSNMQTFFDAYAAAPGDKMYRDPEDRVDIW